MKSPKCGDGGGMKSPKYLVVYEPSELTALKGLMPPACVGGMETEPPPRRIRLPPIGTASWGAVKPSMLPTEARN